VTSRACPICEKPAVVDYRPFCSRRCANVDLQRWLTGRYALGESEEDGSPTWAQDLDQTPPER
jgi:endogenous inhibitor of DNA gyrase (YacG/DUF329 family)